MYSAVAFGTLKANIEAGNTGIKNRYLQYLSTDNGGGVLTLQNVDVIDATTEATLEAAIDTVYQI